MGILKWLADKSVALNKKSLDFALMASFHRRISGLERTHPELSEEQRIGAALYEILDERYPEWDKEDKRNIISQYNSCVLLTDFLFNYEQMHGKTKDAFRGLSERFTVMYGPSNERVSESFLTLDDAIFFAREKAKDIKGSKKVMIIDHMEPDKGYLIRPNGRVDVL